MAENVTNPRELFLMQLGEMLYVEQSLSEKVLPELHEQVGNKHLRERIKEHHEQTREHVRNVERVFGLLGEMPRSKSSAAFDGLNRDHDRLVKKIESGELRDLFNAAAAAHTEHFEISAYHSLITLASILGEPDAVRLLEQNLHEEEETLEKVEKSVPEELTTQLVT
jgi:ferritin-like metal-binding protein YciE